MVIIIIVNYLTYSKEHYFMQLYRKIRFGTRHFTLPRPKSMGKTYYEKF
ncbi:hypothetical protein CLOHYLEM_07692 [[Clostridium] hylemonae DSM 15053]|uniref:Uncharacterized protein n=1 Tax=[Clostridium] hylemonae DSM 15053 TaxID=553973 RepID=C0C6F5_9FIRM|nr:hypothetical protein CLOHYLEM_07692 [[Clostridium] hylemonae DSM 15053]